MQRKLLPFLLVGLLFITAARLAFAEQGVSASIEPTEIGVGEQAQLIVRVQGRSSVRPKIPELSGLEISSAGQSSRVQILNGEMTASVDYLYIVEAHEVGSYSISPITVALGGRNVSAEPVRLEVMNNSGRGGRRRTPSFSQNSPFSSFGIPNQDRTARGEPFIKLSSVKRDLYVGEMIPVEIKVYIPVSMNLRSVSPPEVVSDSYGLHNAQPEPEQTREAVDGELYNVLQWNSTISAIKEGTTPMEIKLKGIALVRERAKRGRSPFGRGLFDDSIADEFFADFFGQTKEQEMVIQSETQRLDIHGLPAAGRPANFSGAVGRFTVSVSASPFHAAVGDPITVKTIVKGRGGFDRVAAPVPATVNGWKVYKPTASFEALDSVGFEGKKTFEQVFIPNEQSLKELPPLEFSYFDPSEGKYVQLRTEPQPVLVSPGVPGQEVSSAKSVTMPVQPSERLQAKNTEEHVLAPVSVELGEMVSSLRPLIRSRKGVVLSACLVWLLFCGLVLQQLARRRASDPQALGKRALRQRLEKACAEMEQAVRANDSQKFFVASRKAIQEHFGFVWKVAPEAITLAELRERAPQAVKSIELFEKADAMAYSGQVAQSEELRSLKELILAELN